jgi:multidrug efflux pump subunit AcrA (membrane-fusion protein)
MGRGISRRDFIRRATIFGGAAFLTGCAPQAATFTPTATSRPTGTATETPFNTLTPTVTATRTAEPPTRTAT